MRKGLGPRGRGASPDKRVPWKLKRKVLPSNVVVFSENYKHQETYFFLLFEEGKPCDVIPVKTSTTLLTYLEGWKRYGIAPLFLPNPVKVRKEYWERYRQGARRNPYVRLGLAKEFGLLKDEAILKLKVLVLDIDSPYEEVLPVWNELKEKLGIEKGYWVVKTKSGNFRAYIFLEPTVYERTYKEVVNGEVKEKMVIYEFWLRPEGKGRNGKTHLENVRELLHVIYAFFERRGLKADRTFPNRINHPIWVEGWEVDGKKSEIKEVKEGYAGRLYDLYRKAKKLQREENLWTFGGINLTQRFWPEKFKKEVASKGKVIVPEFIAKQQVKKLDYLMRWKIAVAKLAEKHTSHRFCNVMLPAVGWAKYLGLSRSEVDDYLREVIPDKKNFDVDIEKAWTYARPITFEWKGEGLRTEDLLRKFLVKANGGVLRSTLLKEVFGGRNYLLQFVERFLLKNGFVYIRKEKVKKGRGRKAYIYFLTEKGKAFLEALDKGKGLRKALEEVQGFEKVAGGEELTKSLENERDKKSIYITPFREQRSGLVVAGNGKTLSYQQSEKVFVSDNITDGADKAGGAGGAGSAGVLKLSSETPEEEKRKEKERRTERLIQARWLYVETWKAFRLVKEKLEKQGIKVWDSRYEVPDTGLDGRKLLKLVRYLLTNKTEVLNLAGWGRYALPILKALKEVGLVSSETKVILPLKATKLERKPEDTLEEEFEEWLTDKRKRIEEDLDIDEIPF